MGEIEKGNQAGDIALELMEKLQANRFKAKILTLVYHFIRVWQTNLHDVIAPLAEGYQAGLESGDFEFAAYCAFNHCQITYFAGTNLSETQQKMEDYGDAIFRLNQTTALNFHQIGQQAVLNWIGDSEEPDKLIGDIYNETERLPQHQAASDSYAIAAHSVHKLILAYHFANPDITKEIACTAEKTIAGVTGTVLFSCFYFYRALAELQLTAAHIDEGLVITDLEKLANWSVYCPATFIHKCDLIRAEQCRISRKHTEAMELYDRAIAGAKENEYLQEEALANELAAKFYLDWGREKVATVYMQEAYYCYSRWGAKAKTDVLVKQYPRLLAPILQQTQLNATLKTALSNSISQTPSRISTKVDETLDLASLMKAARTLSQDIDGERTITNLMHVIQENAGAETVALLLFNNGKLDLEAKLTNGQSQLIETLSADDDQAVPLTIINTVKRTHTALVLADARAEMNYAQDAYIQLYQPCSVLCLPLSDHGRQVGILYLENNQCPGAFTKNRVKILTLLCAQAAITLQNARLVAYCV